MYLCYKRDIEGEPIVGIEVTSQEEPGNPDVIDKTPYGRSANVNNSTTFNSTPLYLKVKRDVQSPYVITDLAVVLANKGEEEPLGYSRLNENLNRGVVGSTVYIAFKQRPKSVHRASYRRGCPLKIPYHVFMMNIAYNLKQTFFIGPNAKKRSH